MITPPPRRLDPCPCGSGRRYRDCHGALGPKLDASALQDAAALNLQGLAQQAALDLDGALASFERAIALAPAAPEAHFNRSLALLLLGRYREGWEEYAWRTRVPGYADYANFPFGMPRWRGEPLAGRRIMVHGEQGHGDTIQFARFLGRLADEGAEVDLFCHPPLVSMLSRVEGVRHAFSQLDERPTHDFHGPIVDVAAHCLPDVSAIHWWHAYLSPQPARAEAYSRMLAPLPRPWIGIAWKGSPRHGNDRNRSLAPGVAAALVRGDATFVDLQIEAEPLPGTVRPAPPLRDWEDTLALVSRLDHVVAVDTAVAHLAGALGRTVHVLLPFSPDWRWGLASETTRWYPTMRLLRQAAPGDWAPVIERAVARYPRA